MSKKASRDTKTTVESTIERSLAVSDKALRIIDAELDRIAAGGAVVGGDEAVRAALLGQKAASIGAEVRKTAKDERAAIREITPATVREWVRLQPPEARARLRKDLEALDGRKGSVLA